MTSKLYVGNLAYSVKDADLSQLFSGCGTVASSRVVTDPQTGRSKGFAFVEMSDDEGAQKAIAELNGKDFQGRPLRVDAAKPKENTGGPRRRDFGGGGGGGGGGGPRRGGGGGGNSWRD